MSESPDPMNEAFERRCRPRHFEEVCVLALDDDCDTDDLSWFSVGLNSEFCAGIRGFVFELGQFSRQRPLKAGLEQLVQFMLLVNGRGGVLNFLHGRRFVERWFLEIPPQNFETEGEAVGALKTMLKARRLRADLGRRLTTCGLSLPQIAVAAGLFESDVRRIAAGQQKPSDAVVLLISSALDSLTTSGPRQPDGAA
jgi:hypothetical protein